MKKYLTLLLLLPLSVIAAEHGGLPLNKKSPAMQESEPAATATEHGGQAMKKKDNIATEAEHGGQAMEKKVPGLLEGEHASSASEHGGQAVKKKATEHAGEALK